MQKTDKIYMAIIILFYYIGDLLTTWRGLNNGGYEANPVLSDIGFIGTIILKTLFIILMYILFTYMSKYEYHPDWNKYNVSPSGLKGFLSGAVVMVGIIAIGINTGWYA